MLPELTKDVQLVAMEICERLGKRVESCSIMFVLVHKLGVGWGVSSKAEGAPIQVHILT